VRPFLVCIHDATPAYERETEIMIRDLAPLVGRRLSFGVVPDWHDRWALASHSGYCRLVQGAAEELLLHGYSHRRRRGYGPVSWIAEGCDEMGGLDPDETCRVLQRGQQAFVDAFGERARGFVPPGWEPGRVQDVLAEGAGLDYILGYSSLRSPTGWKVPLATSSWDCGRWGWLGYVGEGAGRAMQGIGPRIVSLAIHPRDLKRGFWPRILRYIRDLVERGHAPTTPGRLMAGLAC
jgi:hypothetical protein